MMGRRRKRGRYIAMWWGRKNTGQGVRILESISSVVLTDESLNLLRSWFLLESNKRVELDALEALFVF